MITDFDLQQKILHSPFKISIHKETFIHYLEVCIDEDGVVYYAVPSHVDWLWECATKKMNISKAEVADVAMTSGNTWLDFLLEATNSVAVWSDRFIGKPNAKQKNILSILAKNGLYEGELKW